MSEELSEGKRRARSIAMLLGIHEAEAADRSLTGRLSLISKLRAARATEIARGRAGSWLYDLNRHLSICAYLRAEYEALSDALASTQHVPPGERNAGTRP